MLGFGLGQFGRVRGAIGAAVAAYNPATQFGGGGLGLWYDPSDYATQSQESAGTTAVTGVGQTVGLMLDKRLGLARGPDVLNGGFATDTVWNKNIIWTISGGVASDNSGSGQVLSQAHTELLAVGDSVEYSFNIKTIAGGNVYAYIGGEVVLASIKGTVGIQRGIFKIVTLTSQQVGLISGTTPTGITVDDVSIRKLPGNHIIQATAAARALTATSGAIQYLTFDGVDDSLATGAITLSADMDCFIAMRRNSSTGILAYTTAGSGVYLGAIDATAGVASAGAGTPTYAVNGVAVPGGTATTRAQLAAAIPVGSWVVVEILNANLSTWTALGFNAYTGFILGSEKAGDIFAPAGDATTRTNNRKFLGAKVGLTL